MGKKERKKSGEKKKKKRKTKRVKDKRRILYGDFSMGEGGTKLPFPKHIFEKWPTHFSPSPCRNFSSAQSSPGCPDKKQTKSQTLLVIFYV